jgi:hypothetical protein
MIGECVRFNMLKGCDQKKLQKMNLGKSMIALKAVQYWTWKRVACCCGER